MALVSSVDPTPPASPPAPDAAPRPYAAGTLSVVSAVYRNQGSLRELTARLFTAAQAHFAAVEIIYINDASPDDSRRVLAELAAADARIKVINFARNFGQHAALMAGLRAVRGDYVFFIDADLEEDPAHLGDFLRRLQEGFEIVVGMRDSRRGIFRTAAGRLYAAVHNLLSDFKVIENASTMRLMTRRFTDYLLEFSETPYIGGFTSWIGLPIGTIPITWHDQGRVSSYTLLRLLRHARAGIIGFSTKLMRISLYTGLLTSALSFSYGSLMISRYFLFEHVPPGFSSIVVLISFLMGLQFIFLGIFGEYLMEIYLATKRRPQSLIYDTLNLPPADKGGA